MRRVLLVVSLGLFSSSVLALAPVTSFGSNPGGLSMYEHVPDASGPLPLVVVLHGCAQDEGYAEDAGLVALADEHGVALAVAVQGGGNNAQRCFNWFLDADVARDAGEALSIKQMVDDMKARHDIDEERVFVTGLSAGAAMSVVVLAAYPDVFSAGAVFAGVPYRCGVGVQAAFECMQGNAPARSQAEWAALVTDAAPAGSSMPRIAIWHGDADATVHPSAADDLVLQWTGVHGVPAGPSGTVVEGAVTRSSYGDVVESVRVAGMGHGMPVAPPCGSAGAFFPDVGSCGGLEALRFFSLASSSPGAGEGEGDDAPVGCACVSSAPSSRDGVVALLSAAMLLSIFRGRARRDDVVEERVGRRRDAARDVP